MSRLRVGATATSSRRDGDGGVHPHHQAAAFEHVAERNEGEQSERVADLGCDGDEAGAAGGGAVGWPISSSSGWL